MDPVRFRTLTAVAAIVLAAGGVATAVATHGSPAAQGPAVEVSEALVRAVNLFPTSSSDPDPAQVAVTRLPASVDSNDVPKRLTAACTNCAPGSPEAAQFQDLVVEVVGVYKGPLQDLDATVAPGAVVKVWLADSGRPQVQGVTSEWSFTSVG